MTFFTRLTLLLPVFCLIFNITATTVQADEGSSYGQWQSADDRLENLINDLDRIIDEGTKARAAHPGFLQDLNTIIDQYRSPQKLVFFADDFTDNNFSENPTWIVSQGSFSIDSYGSLHSSVAASRPVAGQEAETESESDEDRNLRILLGVLSELTKEENDPQAQKEEGETRAVISSTASIANSFNLEFSFRSDSEWGSTSIGMILGDDPQSGYHLVYQAAPSEDRPMQLIKYRYGKPYIIDEVYENPPNLDDAVAHTIRLSRAPNGDMVVSVDSLEVMRTADLSYRDDFTGVIIVNNGGSYSYDNIEFYTEQ
jgi:hypothetical protein